MVRERQADGGLGTVPESGVQGWPLALPLAAVRPGWSLCWSPGSTCPSGTGVTGEPRALGGAHEMISLLFKTRNKNGCYPSKEVIQHTFKSFFMREGKVPQALEVRCGPALPSEGGDTPQK